MKKDLNPEQLQAVQWVQGPLLVLAGAGSGKTRVIEYRSIFLVEEMNVPPSRILLLTFTRKAAYEMIQRAARHSPDCQRIQGGTFHSFAYNMLRQYGSHLGLPRFTLLDRSDSEDVLELSIQELGFRKKKERFPKKETVLQIFQLALSRRKSIEDVLKESYPQFLNLEEELEKLRQHFTQYKLEKSYVDYDDLLVYLHLLLEDESLGNKIRSHYSYIMVDEYQDTNYLQGRITYLLGKDHKNVMAVGDDAQSIYSFRGAFFKNIHSFPKLFSPCKIIKLEKNYRSTQSILNLANALLEGMSQSYSKSLVSAKGLEGEKPLLVCLEDIEHEAEWIADQIKKSRDEGIELAEQAVLFRSSHLSIPLQTALTKRKIPFQVYGGKRFYETAHVKDLLAHFRVLVNPRDEVAWRRTLSLLPGIGPGRIRRFLEPLQKFQTPLDGFLYLKKESYFQYFEALFQILEEGIALLDNLSELYSLLMEYYQPLLERKFDNWKNRWKDLAVLEGLVAKYGSIEEMLSELTLEPIDLGLDEVVGKNPDEEPLALSTIHSAKGLEWRHLYLIGALEGVLPSPFSVKNEEELEEEARLLYVAITRGKEKIWITFPGKGKGKRGQVFHRLSRFLDKPHILPLLKRIQILPKEDPSQDVKSPSSPVNKEELLKKIQSLWK